VEVGDFLLVWQNRNKEETRALYFYPTLLFAPTYLGGSGFSSDHRPKFYMTMLPSIVIGVLFLAFLLPACQPAGGPSSSPSLESNPSLTLSLTPSVTATETPTETITPTPSPTPLPTATPTISPTALPMPRLRILFYSLSEGSLMILDSTETPISLRPLVESPVDPSTSPIRFSGDGDWIVFLGLGELFLNDRVFSVNADGTRFQTLLSGEKTNQLEIFSESVLELGIPNFALVPGTSKMLFTLEVVFVQGNQRLLYDLFSLDAKSGRLNRIFPIDKGGIPFPSPDGRKLALTRCETVFLTTINGKIIRPDILPISKIDNRCQDPAIVWAPDSSNFGAIVRSEKESLVWSVDSATGASTLLGNLEQKINGVLSPSLDCIADPSLTGDSYTSFPYFEPIAGSMNLRLLKMAGSTFISFSPDGKHFAFYKSDNRSAESLYIGSLDGQFACISIGSAKKYFRWINNSQFVYLLGKTIQLGDIGGNSVELFDSASGEITIDGLLDAIDIDF
jgi:hypothetical protein